MPFRVWGGSLAPWQHRGPVKYGFKLALDQVNGKGLPLSGLACRHIRRMRSMASDHVAP